VKFGKLIEVLPRIMDKVRKPNKFAPGVQSGGVINEIFFNILALMGMTKT
jgi:hypothetical protein